MDEASALDATIESQLSELEPVLRVLINAEQNGSLDAEDPGPAYGRVAREYRSVRFEDGIALFRFADVVAARANPALARGYDAGVHPGMGSREPLIPLHLRGSEHTQFRRLLDPLLAPRAIAYLESDVRDLTNELIDRFVERGEVEFCAEFAVPLPCLIFLRLLGLPERDLDLLREIEEGILHNAGYNRLERGQLGLQAGDRLRQYLAREMDRREAEPIQNDLIGRFMTFEIDGQRLSREEIINICHTFVVAGLDTVTASLTCIVGWLARHPREQQILRDDTGLIPGAIEELMRYHTPVIGSHRLDEATADFDVNGIKVSAGEKVSVCLATANHDPLQFPDPERVTFDRPGNRHVAFAPGVHRCAGSHLARLEIRAALSELLRRIPEYAIKPGEQPIYTAIGIRQATYLPLVF